MTDYKIQEAYEVADELHNNTKGRFIDSSMSELDYPYDVMCNYEKSYGRNFRIVVENLYKLGLTFKEVRETFRYVGGDGMTRTENPNHIQSAQQIAHEKYFELIYGDRYYPDHELYCICETSIIENCYIARKSDKFEILCWGNCCIKRFMKASNRTCDSCGDTHRNRKYNLCNSCKDNKYNNIK